MHRYNEKIMREGVKQSILKLLETQKCIFFPPKIIKKHIIEDCPWIERMGYVYRLFKGSGMTGLLTSCIQSLRYSGYSIESSDEKGKGYTLTDPNNPKTLNIWDKRFRAIEIKRDLMPDKERETEFKNFINDFKNCIDPKIREGMRKIAVKYKVKTKKE